MACQYGSEKRQSAPQFINPNEIGVLCFLFGLEGPLCRLLDLLPEAIKKIATLNPNIGNPNDVFEDILKSVTKRTLGLIIDDITGQINVNQYCQTEPPPAPDEITFNDIFIFIAELVPTLDYFFQANEIISGENTRILDKIVGLWLRKKWFENCQCKEKPKTPEGLPDPNENQEIPVEPQDEYCPGDPDNKRCKKLSAAVNPIGIAAIYSCKGFYEYTEDTESYNGELPDGSPRIFKYRYKYLNTQETQILADGSRVPIARLTIAGKQYRPRDDGSYYVSSEATLPVYRSRNGSNYVPTDGDYGSSEYDPCPPPPPPPRGDIPPEFCTLFPDDDFCLDDGGGGGGGNCDEIEITVMEFSTCGDSRTPKTVKLLNSGNTLSIQVTEFTECEQGRQIKSIEVFECNP